MNHVYDFAFICFVVAASFIPSESMGPFTCILQSYFNGPGTYDCQSPSEFIQKDMCKINRN